MLVDLACSQKLDMLKVGEIVIQKSNHAIADILKEEKSMRDEFEDAFFEQDQKAAKAWIAATIKTD
jgi:hypothetical protein